MALDSLKLVLPPPSAPICVPAESEWRAAQEEYGATIPVDLKEFVAEYGAGCIDGFLWIFSPATQNPHIDMRTQFRERSSVLQQLRDKYSWDIPHPIHPDPGCLVPWAQTDNGDVLYWVPTGGGYSVVVQDSRAPEWDEFELRPTDFLEKLLTREIVVTLFPETWPSGPHRFALPTRR